MEARILCPAEQTMEDMSHFMEESHYIIVAQQSRLFGCGFCQISNHSCYRVATRTIALLIAGKDRPDSRMRIFGS